MMAVDLKKVLAHVNSSLLVLGCRERAVLTEDSACDPSVDLGGVTAYLDDAGHGLVADVHYFDGSFYEPPSSDLGNEQMIAGDEIAVAREIVRRAMLQWIDERFDDIAIDAMMPPDEDVFSDVALPPRLSVAVLSLRDPDDYRVEAWTRDAYQPYIAMNQLTLARAVGIGFCNGFYIARALDESVLSQLGLSVAASRFWHPTYFHVRNAIREVSNDPILCARVALELTKPLA